MKEKAVSVIIPCYNVEEYLPRCVSSLLSQTIGLENLELIFVDDGSSDGTLEYLYGMEEQYPSQVMVISYPGNQGQGAARNIGMSYATGKYIGFVDADDWILPQMYEEMYQKAEQIGCEMVDSYHVCLSKGQESCVRGRFREERFDSIFHIQNDEQRRELLAAGMGALGMVNVTCKLYRRDFLEKYQLRFVEKYAFEDLYFSDMLLFYLTKFCVMQAEYYNYYIHPGSTMTAMDGAKWFEQRKMMQVWLEHCIERGLFESYYHEIEFIFGRDYYLSNLHYVFTRGAKDMESIVQNSQKVMQVLFPNVEKNPYIAKGGEMYLRDFQKDLFKYVSKDFQPGEIGKVRDNYLKKALEIARDEKESKQPKINVMLAADRNYLYPAMVMITSIFSNHQKQKVTIYLLQTGFTEQDLEEISLFANKWENQEICCIEVKKEQLKGLRAFGRFSVAAFFRILGLILLPETVQNILYLDADMVVNKNLSELFSEERKMPLAACYDVNNYLQGNIEQHKAVLGISTEYSYFNSGMLYMDLSYMRERNVAKWLLSDIEKHFEEYSLVDQDALNKYFYRDTEYLPWQEYNCPCVPFLSRTQDGRGEESLITYPEFYKYGRSLQRYDITEMLMKNAGIIHFCTSQKPWEDREFYQQGNMKAAMEIYQRYETLYREVMQM